MKKFLVIGNPIEHSLSPKLHSYWIKQNKIDAVYDKKKLKETDIKGIISKIKDVYECCAVAVPESFGGNALYLFVASKNNNLNDIISKKILGNFGSFALPKKIYYISEMPKNKSGKMLRRVLRTILENPNTKDYGDLSTILNKKILFEAQKKVLENG